MRNNYLLLLTVVALLASLPVCSAEPVTLAVDKSSGHDVIKLQNYRITITIDPTRGGAVTSYSDRLAPAELVLQQKFSGLCMDHFQEQNWPGELLEVPYEYKIAKQTPDEVQVTVTRKASGLWQTKVVNKKISDIQLEKTYTLRADSPAIICTVKLTMPEEPKVYSYWLQNVFFAGGDYDPATDRTFRPSARGVRSSGREKNGMYGSEEWMRDFSAGWMALIDTRKKTGLAMACDYDDLRINYACGGNMTNEFMFNTTYQPKAQNRTYTIQLMPVVGMDKVMSVSPQLIAGYAIKTDNTGGGKVDFSVVRSALAVNDLTFDVTIAGAANGKETPAGKIEFTALTDQPQVKSLTFTNAPLDPVVVRVKANGHTADGQAFTTTFEDYFNGVYSWGDNIQTDMRTPVYAAQRTPQKLTLSKPAQFRLRPEYGGQYLFFQGMFDEDYNIAAALHTANYAQKSDIIYYKYDGSWYGALSDFPYDYDKLFGYDCIVLGGISKSGLKPIGVEMLHDYLQAGGGLIVLGSHGAFGRSQLQGTNFGDAFPVEFTGGVMDLKATGGKPVTFGPDTADFLKYHTLSPQATCYFLHAATPKPGAKVLMQVDGKPFMVAGEYGPKKARIVCILGAPMGDPKKGQIPFWRDAEWYLILRDAIWWASHEDNHFNE
ncbi:MAG: hypothetical protein ACYDBB_00010 [Armatimonadota bacterium]